jgi:single-strand DNA-binding protein
MADLNKIMLLGRLTRDPELKFTNSGIAVCTFTIAVNRTFSKKGENDAQADFFRVKCWRNLAENCAKFLAKGRQVFIEGAIQTSSFTAEDGSKRNYWEVVARDVQFIGKGEQQVSRSDDDAYDMDDNIPF